MWFLLGSCFIGYVYFGQGIIYTIYRTKTNIIWRIEMWSKLKQKIVQVIDIIKKYGVIFSVFKIIWSIIKILFRKLIFDVKQYKKDYQKVEARKQYYRFFQEKWEKTESENDKMFFRLLEADYKKTCKKISHNKRRNFAMKFVCLFVPIVIFTVLFIVLLFYGNKDNFQISNGIYKLNWKFNLYVTVYYVILIILTRIFSRWINVKKYQETWIRHSAHRYELEEEIVKYIEKMEDYKGLNIEERKKTFKKNILKIWDKNQKKFEKNMKNEEELSDIPEIIKKDFIDIPIGTKDKN